MSDKEHQYLVGFEEWWALQPDVLKQDDMLKRVMKLAWSASAERTERIKDGAYSKLKIAHERQSLRYEGARKARLEVHRDDYARAGVLIAGLKNIEGFLASMSLGQSDHSDEDLLEVAQIASDTLKEALVTWRERE